MMWDGQSSDLASKRSTDSLEAKANTKNRYDWLVIKKCRCKVSKVIFAINGPRPCRKYYSIILSHYSTDVVLGQLSVGFDLAHAFAFAVLLCRIRKEGWNIVREGVEEVDDEKAQSVLWVFHRARLESLDVSE